MRQDRGVLLADPQRRAQPWPHLVFEPALPSSVLARLEALFDQPGAWEQHQSVLYDGAMRDVSGQVDPSLGAALSARLGTLWGLPLHPQVQVQLQRMEPGQDVRPHSDPPLLGYECARLVVQLQGAWEPRHGGVLRLHPDAAGTQVGATLPPRRNLGVGFVLGPRSHHSVGTTHVPRHSLVFYLWHRGNRAPLAQAVRALVCGVRLADLPRSMDAALRAADARLGPERAIEAGWVAGLLQAWGAPEAEILRGHQAEVGGAAWTGPVDRVVLARWLVHLHQRGFDPVRWADLAGRVGAGVRRGPTATIAERAFPVDYSSSSA